jgi:U3 small nucleolar RNA-associated protein 12
VTDLAFIDSGKKLVTCSKDKILRVWDLETQHCLQIVGGHRSEIWSLDVDTNGRFLVSGSADPELRFYHIRHESSEEIENGSKQDVLKPFGEIQRQGKDRVANVRFNSSGDLLACQGAGRTVEIYRVLDETEALRKAKRRVNRKKKDKISAKESTGGDPNGTVVELVTSTEVTVSDVFKLLHVLRASKKIVSIAFCPLSPPKGSFATLSLSLNNNMLETYSIDSDKASKLYSIELPGHRSVIRSVTLNPEGNLLLSTSHNAVKIWNPSTGACLRTIDSGYGLCSAFVPGNRYALIGTRSGSLEIVDVGSGTTIEVVEAHTGQIKSIVPIPDEDGSVSGNGFVTGADDNDVKFWEYQLVQRSSQVSFLLT